MKKAVFLDRDGVINVDKGYVYKIEDFEWQEGIFDLLDYFTKKGYLLFVITNQSGIAKGYYTHEDVKRLHDYMVNELRKKGIEIKEIKYCPHLPGTCDCRKPSIKMYVELIKKHNVDPSVSIVIGDKERDVIPGKKLGCLTFRIVKDLNASSVADFKVKDLREILEILENMENGISEIREKHIRALNETISDYEILILKIIAEIKNALEKGKKVLIAGNGGSAADAQHFAAELVVRFGEDRQAMPCIALTTDTSVLTACANDYSFDYIFARQIEALGNEGDVFIAISTSGKSKNILEAIKTAKSKGLKVFGLIGRDGGEMKDLCDCVIVRSDDTAIIQEIHEFILHFIARSIEVTF